MNMRARMCVRCFPPSSSSINGLSLPAQIAVIRKQGIKIEQPTEMSSAG